MRHTLSAPALQSPLLRWGVCALVLLAAALLRFWALSRPDSLVFDELYYVRDAISQLAHGYPTTWPNDEANDFGVSAGAFTNQASTIAHPPLGKWLISIGILLFGPETGWGWRFSAAAAGVLTVGATMLLAYRLTAHWWVMSVAGAFLALDGVHIVLSRVSLLDIFLTLFVVFCAVCVWEDLRSTAARITGATQLVWIRPWLWAAALCGGAAAGVKWSGLYAVAGFGVLIVVTDVLRRLRLHVAVEHPRVSPLTVSLRAAAQAGIAAFSAAVIMLATYLATWLGWILTPGGQGRVPGEPWWKSLWGWHTNSLGWHTQLTAEHPYQSPPLSWPFSLRPTAMYLQHWDSAAGCPFSGGCAAAITPIPNPLITWAGVLALALMLWAVVRITWHSRNRWRVSTIPSAPAPTPDTSLAFSKLAPVASLVLVGYLSGWLPWVLTFSRTAVFQFYAVVLTPFAALALALVCVGLCTASRTSVPGLIFPSAGIPLSTQEPNIRGRRLAFAIFCAATALLSLWFAPVWIGEPTAHWFWRSHLWLPGWQ